MFRSCGVIIRLAFRICYCIVEVRSQFVQIYTGLFISPWNILKISNESTTQRIMVIPTPIERENFQVFFKGKARAQSFPYLPLGDSSNKYDRRPWYADMRVERDGLSHVCLLYYQRWTQWASVKYVKKSLTVSLSIGVRITMIRCVINL
jgi:hypothetical protein